LFKIWLFEIRAVELASGVIMDRRTLLTGMAFAAPAFATPSAAGAAAQDKPADNPEPEEIPLGRKIAELFATSLTTHDLRTFGSLFAENYINHQVSVAAPPPPDGRQGKQLTLALFAARLHGLPDLTVKIEALVATEDAAAASFVYEGTHAGVYLGFEPTGRRLRFTSCDIFAIRNGLIAEHWGMGDIAGVLAQLHG
jgi:ketosteroid isomerase-like protein